MINRNDINGYWAAKEDRNYWELRGLPAESRGRREHTVKCGLPFVGSPVAIISKGIYSENTATQA